MRTHLIAIVIVGAAALCISAIAQLAPGPAAAAAASGLCPAGTSAGQCLDNAVAAINDLERRVAALEAQAKANPQGANTSTTPRPCPAGMVATPMGCRPPNAP